MSNIEQNLQKILSSRYGKDVRQSIHDSIHDCYEDGKAGTIDLVAREQIANLVANEGTADKDSEIVDARVGFNGMAHTSLGYAIRNQISPIMSSLFDEISPNIIDMDDYWIYDGYVGSQTGYKTIVFPVIKGYLYQFSVDTSSLRYGFGNENISEFEHYDLGDYVDEIGIKSTTFVYDGEFKYCALFVGPSTSKYTVRVYKPKYMEIMSSLFDEISPNIIDMDDYWIYDGYVGSQTGYKTIVFPVIKGYLYQFSVDTSSLRYGFGNENISEFEHYDLGDYVDEIGIKSTTFVYDGEFKYCALFVGPSTSKYTVRVYKPKYMEEQKTEVTFEKGNVDIDNTGSLTDSTSRIRSSMFELKKGERITSYYYQFIISFYDLHGNYIGNTFRSLNSWIYDYVSDKDQKAIIICSKEDNSDFYDYEIEQVSNSIVFEGIPTSKENAILENGFRIRSVDGFDVLDEFISFESVKSILYPNLKTIKKKGTKIVDEAGNEIILTGIGTHSISEYNSLYTEDVMRTLAYYGINCIRISVYLSDIINLTASEGRTLLGWLKHSEELKPIIEQIISVATNVGLYIILDWHSYHVYDGDVTQYQSQQEDFFEYFSSKYASYRNILYELHNEPYKNTAIELLPSVLTCSSIIRENNPNAILICGNGGWLNDVDPIIDMNTVFNINNNLNIFISSHLYTGDQTYEDMVKKYVDLGIPIFVSEWGNSALSGDGEITDEEAIKMFNYCHSNKISYCLWKLTYQNMSTAVLNHDHFKINGYYKYGGWRKSDLSHNGNLYFETIRDFRFKS